MDSPGCSSPADSEQMRELTQILSILQPSAVDSQEFLPADKVKEFTTREIVKAELVNTKIKEYYINAFTQFVIEKDKHIFLMLIYSESAVTTCSLQRRFLQRASCNRATRIRGENSTSLAYKGGYQWT